MKELCFWLMLSILADGCNSGDEKNSTGNGDADADTDTDADADTDTDADA